MVKSAYNDIYGYDRKQNYILVICLALIPFALIACSYVYDIYQTTVKPIPHKILNEDTGQYDKVKYKEGGDKTILIIFVILVIIFVSVTVISVFNLLDRYG